MLTTLQLRPGAELPLYRQLIKLIKEEIQKGGLSAGTKLPSIRVLAQALGVSRITVENSYTQLLDEGYLISRPKQGYFVADVRGLEDLSLAGSGEKKLPEQANGTASPGGRGTAGGGFSETGPEVPEALSPDRRERAGTAHRSAPASLHETPPRYNFRSNAVDSESFNAPVWRRYMNHALKQQELLASYGPAQGEERLLYTLAKYSFEARDVQCRPEQIVVGAGTQSLLHILCGILQSDESRHFDAVGLPFGFLLAEQIFRDHHYRLLPFHFSDIRRPAADPELGLVCCNPSNPYRSGSLPAALRLSLLRWAQRQNILILEDDYIGEFRYLSRPFPSLQSLSGGDGVIYLGSFSRTMLPSLRISYMVLPPSLLPAYQKIRDRYNQTASGMEQLALADFIADGHLNRHIRRLRRLYGAKNQLLRQAIGRCFPQNVTVTDYEGALRLLLLVDSPLSAEELAGLAQGAGLAVIPLPPEIAEENRGFGGFSSGDPGSGSLPQIMLSYAGIPEKDILPAVQALARAWNPVLGRGKNRPETPEQRSGKKR